MIFNFTDAVQILSFILDFEVKYSSNINLQHCYLVL